MELEVKEKDIIKGGANKGSDSRQQRKELKEANNALKTEIHTKKILKEKERYELQHQVDEAQIAMEEMRENLKTYTNILNERKTALVNKYLNKH